MVDLAGDIATRSASLDTQDADLVKRQATHDAADLTRADRQSTEMTPLESSLQTTMDEPLPQRQAVELPKPPDLKKLVDPKEYEGLSYALIGMALIGGATSKGNWLGVSSALNGALKGYSEGNQEKAQQEMKRYDTEFKAAKERENQANKEYEDVLNNRKLSINEQLQRIKILATQHGREDIRAAAEQKSIDALHKQIEAGRSQLLGTEQRSDAVKERLEQQRTMHEMKVSAARAGSSLTDAGAEWAAKFAEVTGAVPSLFGGKARIFNQLAEKGVDPAQVASNKGEYAAINTALRQQESRAAGIENITASIQKLEPEVLRLAGKVGLSGTSLVNTPMNVLRAKLGSSDLAELRTVLTAVSREYIRATTAPQSQGQLHVASQEMSDELLNSSMGIGQMIGSMRGMNTDIAAGKLAATGIAARLRDRIKANGGTLRPELGGGERQPAERPPADASDADVLNFYKSKSK